jgi:NAD(P)H-quinone oxidoreductase subunit 5
VVGAVTYRFSLRYLDGNPRHGHFLRWHFATVCAAYLMTLSDNLLFLWAAWFITSIGLHQLLTFYPERSEAFAPARKKFLISRLGDLALISAIAVIWGNWQTVQLHAFLARAAVNPDPHATGLVALLIATAALTKSAQLPFHSWLPETMESPTPVSALMHAGIINAGGSLLLRFAPVVAASAGASLLLVAIGTLTAILGLLATWAQVKVKRTLAWSTVAQMGFMMVQCGLGVFPAALLHIVGHGLYKAYNFLRAGELPAVAKQRAHGNPGRTLSLLLVGFAVAAVSLAIARPLTGFDPLHTPGEMALSVIIAMGLAQLWLSIAETSGAAWINAAKRFLSATAVTVVCAVCALAIYRALSEFFGPELRPLAPQAAIWTWAVACIPVIGLTAVTLFHALLPSLAKTRAGRSFYVHALHGFYLGTIADQCVARIWPNKKELSNA